MTHHLVSMFSLDSHFFISFPPLRHVEDCDVPSMRRVTRNTASWSQRGQRGSNQKMLPRVPIRHNDEQQVTISHSKAVKAYRQVSGVMFKIQRRRTQSSADFRLLSYLHYPSRTESRLVNPEQGIPNARAAGSLNYSALLRIRGRNEISQSIPCVEHTPLYMSDSVVPSGPPRTRRWGPQRDYGMIGWEISRRKRQRKL